MRVAIIAAALLCAGAAIAEQPYAQTPLTLEPGSMPGTAGTIRLASELESAAAICHRHASFVWKNLGEERVDVYKYLAPWDEPCPKIDAKLDKKRQLETARRAQELAQKDLPLLDYVRGVAGLKSSEGK